MHPILLFLHLAGVVLWVGGMFFAWMCLRPVAAVQLEPPARLKLWVAVFARFFPWVWGAAPTIVLSGLALGQIRRLVGFNLILGFVTIAVASLGRLLG